MIQHSDTQHTPTYETPRSLYQWALTIDVVGLRWATVAAIIGAALATVGLLLDNAVGTAIASAGTIVFMLAVASCIGCVVGVLDNWLRNR